MRVLFVDDEPLARADLARVLSARDDIESFDSTSNAVEGRDNLERSSDDVMLLDINMPEISGLNLLDQLQGNKRPLPSVVFVTAYEEHAIRSEMTNTRELMMLSLTRSTSSSISLQNVGADLLFDSNRGHSLIHQKRWMIITT